MEFFVFASFFVFACAATIYFGVGAGDVVVDDVFEITAVLFVIIAIFILIKNVSGLTAFQIEFICNVIKKACNASAFGFVIGVSKTRILGKFSLKIVGGDNFAIIF